LTDRNTLLAVARRFLVASGVPSAGETVVVALSGGADSVALADVLVTLAAESGFHAVLAHLDHRLRPESTDDARFCASLAASWGAPLHVEAADVRGRAARDHAGIEDAARRERYAFLRRVRDAAGARWIALGHTRDDQAETLLLRLLRGAGTDGLACMRPVAGDLLRPLLAASRAEVLAHLQSRGLAWREDASNADPAFLRNRVRGELLPYLEARFNPAVREGLARTAELLAEDAEALASGIEGAYAAAARREGPCVVLDRVALRDRSSAELRRILRRALAEAGGLDGISARHVECLRRLALAPSASGRRVMLPGRRQALVSFAQLRIGPAATATASFVYPLPVPGRVELPDGRAVTAVSTTEASAVGVSSAVVPSAYGLSVRTRQPGDRVSVAGREMSLKRFLMKERVPSTDRAALPLIAAGSHVLWVPGQAPTVPASWGGPAVRVTLEGRA
jgi:tRNA(Ile)-lysidine synthase